MSVRLQVVRCFEDKNVIHVAGKVDPVEDIDVINFELALADITQIEKRLERIVKGRAKTKEEIASNEVPSLPGHMKTMPLAAPNAPLPCHIHHTQQQVHILTQHVSQHVCCFTHERESHSYRRR